MIIDFNTEVKMMIGFNIEEFYTIKKDTLKNMEVPGE